MKTIRFEDMSLYTLSNLWNDCRGGDGWIRESDKRITDSIQLYMTNNRPDDMDRLDYMIEKNWEDRNI